MRVFSLSHSLSLSDIAQTHRQVCHVFLSQTVSISIVSFETHEVIAGECGRARFYPTIAIGPVGVVAVHHQEGCGHQASCPIPTPIARNSNNNNYNKTIM